MRSFHAYLADRAKLALVGVLACLLVGSPAHAEEPLGREVGCFPDNRDADPLGTRGHDLAGAAIKSPAMTVKQCLRVCLDQGFKYAGLQDGSWCFCGNTYGRYKTGGATCTTKCAGDPSQICGGEWANSIWQVLDSKASMPATGGTPQAKLQTPKRFDRPKIGGISLDSRPSATSSFDVVGVAHSFCQQNGFSKMMEYRVADARQTIAIDDGTQFANDKGSYTSYRFILCGP